MLQDIVFRAEMCLPRKCTECAKHHVVSKNAYLFWSHALAYTLQHVHLSSVFWFWLAHFRQMHLAYAPVMNDNACLLCIATINHLNKCPKIHHCRHFPTLIGVHRSFCMAAPCGGQKRTPVSALWGVLRTGVLHCYVQQCILIDWFNFTFTF